MTSKEFRAYCKKHKFIQSMGATGVCWDCQDSSTWFRKNWGVQADAA